MPINRVMTTVTTSDLSAAKPFYTDFLGLHLHYDSDWFCILKPSPDSPFEIGLLRRDHAVVPPGTDTPPGGVYMTLVVDDVLDVADRARARGIPILDGPTDLFYGQRRLLVRDPDGFVIDISSPTPRT